MRCNFIFQIKLGFDDSYNVNCTGDYFNAKKRLQRFYLKLGHYRDDYNRDIVKKKIYFSFKFILMEVTKTL